MSSGIAAPSIAGRSLRTRTLGHESARELQRKQLRRHLRVTTLHALEHITGSGLEAGGLVAEAGDAATELRGFVNTLACAEGRTAVAELQRQVGATLHDSTLQALEYLGTDGYGADLDADTICRIADDAAIELRGSLLRLGADEPCELVSALEQLVSAARRRGTVEVEMVTDLHGTVHGADAAALVGAVREALNNVHKHANASRVVVSCETSPAGARVAVRDDGVGINLRCVQAGIGLRHSIQERMASRGGQAHVASAPGHGTLVTLTTGGPQEVAA
jgi:signal transduction histidine kinase